MYTKLCDQMLTPGRTPRCPGSRDSTKLQLFFTGADLSEIQTGACLIFGYPDNSEVAVGIAIKMGIVNDRFGVGDCQKLQGGGHSLVSSSCGG